MGKGEHPSRKRRAYALMCRLLTCVSWEILSHSEQQLAIEIAYGFGGDFADEWPPTPDDPATPNRDEYVRTAVAWCHRLQFHVNDVELAIWRSSPDLESDPRVLAWIAGCEVRREELGQ